jgi:hypothetical protein
MLLHRNLHIMIKDPRDNKNKVKIIIHVGNMERMDMSIRNASRSETI